MKKVLSLLILLSPFIATNAEILPNYEAIEAAVKDGKRIRVVANLSDCPRIPSSSFMPFLPKLGRESTVSHTPSLVILTQCKTGNCIKFSDEKFTLDYPNAYRKPTKIHFNYTMDSKYLRIETLILEPTTYKIRKGLGMKGEVICPLGSGISVYAD